MTLLQDRFEIVTGGKAWMAPDPDGTDVGVLAMFCASPHPPSSRPGPRAPVPPPPGGLRRGRRRFSPLTPA